MPAIGIAHVSNTIERRGQQYNSNFVILKSENNPFSNLQMHVETCHPKQNIPKNERNGRGSLLRTHVRGYSVLTVMKMPCAFHVGAHPISAPGYARPAHDACTRLVDIKTLVSHTGRN